MRSSYKQSDVTLLLKDITGLVEPLPAEKREPLIQQGMHYSEMLPLEYVPAKEYMKVYEESLETFGQKVADSIAILSDKLYQKFGKNLIIVSLARAGTPIGILVKRYLKFKYNIDVYHYSISIIRGKGIDTNAVAKIYNKHPAEKIVMLDGWTGKGAIYRELMNALDQFPGIPKTLAVVSDPGNLTELCGTHEDILIPSSCLNSTVSGLISRTFLRDDIIDEAAGDYHGAAYYGQMEKEDRTYDFIDHIESLFVINPPPLEKRLIHSGLMEVGEIAFYFGISDINFVKPGIGETTRVLLRRIPDMVLVDHDYIDSPELATVLMLAKNKNVPVKRYHMDNYKCCGIIRQLADT